jgi:NAD(P)-dependent dehydrogenase (short-subunit alcohol dehydrogenase family)
MAPARNALDNRVVVVADADGTRGAALARALTAADAVVVLTGVDADALGALAAELVGAGARVAVFAGDAASDEGRAALVELVNELFGPRSG